MRPPLDGWESAESFFTQFIGDHDVRAEISRINLWLLRGARQRWSNQISCIAVVGLALGLKSAHTDLSEWVRVEPRPGSSPVPTVAITLQSSTLLRPRVVGDGPVIGATICRVSTAPTVLESFLLQIGDDQVADRTAPFLGTSSGR